MKYCFVYEKKEAYEDIIKYLLEKDIAIFYSKKNDVFMDKGGNKIDITGMKIYPKTGVYQAGYLCDAIVNKGGIPLVTRKENEKVDNWPNYYKTKRKLKVFKGKELLDKNVCEQIKREYGNEVFFKTLNKNYSEIINVDYLLDDKSLLSRTIKAHENDKFVISEKVNRKKDNIGNLEYRVFVIEGRIKSISRITDTVFHKIDKEVYEKILEIIKSLKDFSSSYVIDVFEYLKKEETVFDVVEFNSLPASGTYLYNSIIDFFEENMLHDDIYKIAVEKSKYLEEIKRLNNNKIDIEGSKYFEDQGSFAYDLIGIYMFGGTGMLHFDGVNKIDRDSLGMHGSLISLDNILSSDNFIDEDLTIIDRDSQITKSKPNN